MYFNEVIQLRFLINSSQFNLKNINRNGCTVYMPLLTFNINSYLYYHAEVYTDFVHYEI